MPVGPGKYDPECTLVREATGAALVAVIVMGGDRGQGFSVQFNADAFEVVARLPDLLRTMAQDIEKSMGNPT